MENKLAKIESKELDNVVTKSGLAIQEGEEIKQSYIPFIVQLAKIQEQAKKINFETPVDIDEKIARELRLKTVKIRTGASDLKDERKRIFLLKGNLEQAAYNLIAVSCKLTEETLTNVEKAREIAEKKRIEQLRSDRIAMFEGFQEFMPLGYDFGMLDEQSFKIILDGAKFQMNAKIEAEKKIEAERLAKIEAERIENERIRKENERLQAEKIEMERIAEIERKKQVEILAKQKAESERLAKIESEKQAKIQAELRAKAEQEAKERARIEAELKAKAEQEAKEKAEKERIEKERIESEKKAAAAPDKDKLVVWLSEINLIECKELSTENAKVIKNVIESKFQAFRDWALKQVESI